MTTPQPQPPSCHDTVTTNCPVCGRKFTPLGRQAYCSGACRAAAYRRRRDGAGRPSSCPPPSPAGPSPSTNATAAAPETLGPNTAATATPSCAALASGGPVQAASRLLR